MQAVNSSQPAAAAPDAAAAPAASHGLCASRGDYAYLAPKLSNLSGDHMLVYRVPALCANTVRSHIDQSQVLVTRFYSDRHAQLVVQVPGAKLTADLDLDSLQALSNALRDAIADIKALSAQPKLTPPHPESNRRAFDIKFCTGLA